MGKRRILIIDDDMTITRLVKLGLERLGDYEVREVHHGRESLAAARAFQPDLILLDVCMPDVGGGEVAYRLRTEREFQAIPIVFLTSLVSEQEAPGSGALIGGFHFIAKPPRLERVLACIEKNLANSRRLAPAPGATHP